MCFHSSPSSSAIVLLSLIILQPRRERRCEPGERVKDEKEENIFFLFLSLFYCIDRRFCLSFSFSNSLLCLRRLLFSFFFFCVKKRSLLSVSFTLSQSRNFGANEDTANIDENMSFFFFASIFRYFLHGHQTLASLALMHLIERDYRGSMFFSGLFHSRLHVKCIFMSVLSFASNTIIFSIANWTNRQLSMVECCVSRSKHWIKTI